MKFTIVGDPHIQPGNLDKHQQLFEIIEQLGNPVIILGDTLHTKELIRGECLNFLIRQLKASRLEFTILIGNHDLFNLHTTEHALEALKTLANVRVIDKPTFDGETGFAFIPYIHDLALWAEAYLDLRALNPKVIFAHAGFTGFDYGNSHIAKNELDPELLKGGPLVISGHFHKLQENDELVYLGTPFSNDFAETDQEKFLGIWDNELGSLELILTPFPKHRTLRLNCESSDPGALLKTMLNDTDIFRVLLEGSEESVAKWDRSLFPGIKFLDMFDAADASEVVATEVDSHAVIFSRWAESVKNLTPEVAELGLQLLEEAS